MSNDDVRDSDDLIIFIFNDFLMIVNLELRYKNLFPL